MSRGTTLALLAALCACVFLQAFLSMRGKSLTFDELSYIPAGASYVGTGDLRLNREQPPLMKLLTGVGMLPLAPELPLDDESWALAGRGNVNTQWNFGRAFFLEANENPEALILAARLPVVLVTMLLVVGVFLLARDLYGPGAGLLAAALAAFDPNLLAHGRLATTDLGLACFVLLAVWAYRRATRDPTLGHLLLAGSLLGLALLSKFSGLFLLALYPLWALALPFLREGVAVPRWVKDRWPSHETRQRVAWSAALAGAVVVLGLLVVSLGYLAPGRVDRYFRDFFVVNVNVNRAFLTYFHGAFHQERVPHYFVAAFLLKTPLALLILLGLRAGTALAQPQESWADRLLLLAPVAIWLLVISWQAFQIGLRYILPVYPFLMVWAGGLAASPFFRRRGGRVTVAALLVWLAGSSLAAHPHYLPYFNELAGGSSRGIAWLDDSNVDWGQDLLLLREFLEEEGIDDAFITPMARYDSDLYGIPGQDLLPQEAVPTLTLREPPPGVYAVSVHLLNRWRLLPDAEVDPFRREPMTVLGHTIWVFDLR